MRMLTRLAIAASLLCGCRTAAPPASAHLASLRQQVTDTERAFARTMADRDHASFTSFLAEDAIFFDGDSSVRGKTAVAAKWKPFFEKDDPPFSWEPDQVQVLDSGDLALSTGLVRDPAGNVVGRFNSIWRRESPGRWRIVFDKGSPVCKRTE